MKKNHRLLAAALALCLMLSLCGCSSNDYSAAVRLMEAGDYAAAAESFRTLGSYKDSADKATECDYQQAIALYDAGQFPEAISAFTALGDYAESAEYLNAATTALVSGKIVGKWSSEELDFSGLMAESIKSGIGDNEDSLALLDYMDFSFYTGRLVIEFTENNTFLLSQDEELAVENLEKLMNEVSKGYSLYMIEILEEAYAKEGLTLEEVCTQMGAANNAELVELITEMAFGMSMSDFLAELFPLETLQASVAVKTPGTVSVSGTELKLAVGEETQIYTYDPEYDTITGDDPDLGLENIVFSRVG